METRKPPAWLGKVAVEYWLNHADLVQHLEPQELETFAILCHNYELARAGGTFRERKQGSDTYVRLALSFGLTPMSNKKNKQAAAKVDQLAAWQKKGK